MTGSLLGFFILASQPRMHAQPQSALARSCAAAIALRLVLFDQDCIRMELVFPFDLESPRHSTFDVYGPACHVKTAFVSCHDIIASSVSSGASHVHQIQHHKRHHHQQNQHHRHTQQWTSRCKDGVTEVAYFSQDWQCWVRYGSWFCVRTVCPFLLGHHSYGLTRSRGSSCIGMVKVEEVY